MQNVNAVFETNKKRVLNVLNKDSVKLKFNYIEYIDDFEDITLFDENGEKILDTSILLPKNKAYIVFYRVHFGNLYKNNIRVAIKKLLYYLLHDNDLNYITSAIYLDITSSNIPIYLAEEIGFFPYFLNSYQLYVFTNKNFVKLIENINININTETKEALLKDFSCLNIKYNKYLSYIQKKLESERFALNELKNATENLIQMKKQNIEHYEQILNIANNKKEN